MSTAFVCVFVTRLYETLPIALLCFGSCPESEVFLWLSTQSRKLFETSGFQPLGKGTSCQLTACFWVLRRNKLYSTFRLGFYAREHCQKKQHPGLQRRGSTLITRWYVHIVSVVFFLVVAAITLIYVQTLGIKSTQTCDIQGFHFRDRYDGLYLGTWTLRVRPPRSRRRRRRRRSRSSGSSSRSKHGL